MRTLIISIFNILFFSSMAYSQSISARITNERIEGGEFKWDVEIMRTDDWGSGGGNDILGNSDFYFFCNAAGFTGDNPTLSNIHTSLSGSNNYSLSTGLSGVNSQCFVNLTYDNFGGGSNWYPTLDSWEQVFTVSLTISDPQQNSGLTWFATSTGFSRGNMQPITKTLDGNGDISLPVSLSGFSAKALQNKIVLSWATQSEINNAGFEIYRSTEEDGEYGMLSGYQNNPELEGQGNTNTEHDYDYTDNFVVAGQTYWYKLADIDFAGVRTFHQPVSALLTVDGDGISSTSPDIPKAFKFYPNFPNPFNPETVLRFDIPQLSNGNSQTQIFIHNSLGQLVRKLYSGSLTAGTFEIKWDGKTGFGNVLPSGFYFATLNVGNYYSDTIKMLLVR